MAGVLSGSHWTNFARHRFGYEWSASQHVSGNYSDVTVSVYLQSLDGYGAIAASAASSGSVVIDGQTYGFSAVPSLAANQKKLLYKVTKRVTHGSNGKKNFIITASYNVNTTFNGVSYGTQTTQAQYTLKDIPRAYDFVTNSSSQTLDSPTTFKITDNGSGLKANLYLNMGSKRMLLKENATVGTSFAITVTGADYASQITNGTVGGGYFTVETLSGSTVIGSSRVNVEFSVPNNSTYQPSISSKSVADANSAVVAITGSSSVLVQGKSTLKFTIGASGVYGASITGYQVKVGNVVQTSSSNSISIPLDTFYVGTGSITATITVTDSRGYVSTATLTFTVNPYTAPKITSFSAARNSTTKTTIELKKMVSRSSIKNGSTEKNTYTVVTKYKLTTATSWTTGKTETNTSANFNLTGFDTSKSYDINVTVTDAFGSQASTQTTVSTISFPMNFHKDSGVGVMKMWESDALDVGGKVRATGYKINNQDLMTVLLNRFYPVGCIYESTNSANPNSFMGGTWERFANGKVLVGVDENDADFKTPNLTGGNKTTTHNHGKADAGGALSTTNNVSGQWVVSNTNKVQETTINVMNPYITVYRWRRTA